jgi:uncharacterized protein (DUF2249 family)
VTTSSDVLVASSEEDAVAVGVIARHHAELAAGLGLRVETLLAAADAGSSPSGDGTGAGTEDGVEDAAGAGAAEARGDLVAFCLRDLVPHALAEETTLYAAAAAAPELRLLVAAMIDEHRNIVTLVDALSSDLSPVRAAAAGRALLTLFEVHLLKENDLLVPRLAADPGVSLEVLLAAMHEKVAASTVSADVPAPAQAPASRACGCGGHEETLPELDVRLIPHEIRHATVFGAFDAIAPGMSLVLIAPHDPLPLLHQLEERSADPFRVTYLERGPEAWRLQLTR